MLQLLNITIPIIICLAIGILLKIKNIVSNNVIEGIRKIIVNIMLPALLFETFSTINYKLSDLTLIIAMFFICCLMLFIGFLLLPIFKVENKLMAFFSSGFEVGMLGYSLFALLYGSNNIGSLGIIDIGHTAFVFTLYTALLKKNKGKYSFTIKDSVKDMLTSPVLIALLIGVIVGVSGFGKLIYGSTFSPILRSTTSTISAPLGTLILLTIGYTLDLKNIDIKFSIKSVLLRLASTIVGLIMVYFVKVLLGGLNEYILKAFIFMFILPPPFIIPLFCDEKDLKKVSSKLSIHIIISLVLFVIFAAFK